MPVLRNFWIDMPKGTHWVLGDSGPCWCHVKWKFTTHVKCIGDVYVSPWKMCVVLFSEETLSGLLVCLPIIDGPVDPWKDCQSPIFLSVSACVCVFVCGTDCKVWHYTVLHSSIYQKFSTVRSITYKPSLFCNPQVRCHFSIIIFKSHMTRHFTDLTHVIQNICASNLWCTSAYT